jgi:hypothetical protein
MTYLVTTDTYPGYWGSGATEQEAIENCRNSRGRAPFMVHEIDEFYGLAHVDDLGQVWADALEQNRSKPRREWPKVIVRSEKIGVRGKRTKVSI